MSNPEGGAPPSDADLTEALNAILTGWDAAMGVRLVRATRDELVAELEVGPAHRQSYGIVHGGVYAGLIETLASAGAAINAAPEGRLVVGLENHTSLLRAVREGTLRAVARPLSRGRRTQVWEVTVSDGTGRAVASGRVRLFALERGEPLAGAALELAPGEAGRGELPRPLPAATTVAPQLAGRRRRGRSAAGCCNARARWRARPPTGAVLGPRC
jgi:1,4-dihydroxy-2-naphthoyl-CoA hydrolase